MTNHMAILFLLPKQMSVSGLERFQGKETGLCVCLQIMMYRITIFCVLPKILFVKFKYMFKLLVKVSMY